MEDIADIFDLWPSTRAMATEIAAKPDTVRKWKKFGRIPQEQWSIVIAAAAKLGRVLTADDFMRANAPMKPRGRPSHKPKRRGRRSHEAAVA